MGYRRNKKAKIYFPSDQKFLWTYGTFDKKGPFKETNEKVILERVFDAQKSLEQYTIHELAKQGSHQISINNIVREAKERLNELRLEDHDYLFSFRVTGVQRLWCIKVSENLMSVLWWDPEHKICPSRKRNT